MPGQSRSTHDNRTEKRNRHGKTAMELTRLRVRPLINLTRKFTAIRRDGASVLNRAGIAHARLGAVAHHTIIRIKRYRP